MMLLLLLMLPLLLLLLLLLHAAAAVAVVVVVATVAAAGTVGKKHDYYHCCCCRPAAVVGHVAAAVDHLDKTYNFTINSSCQKLQLTIKIQCLTTQKKSRIATVVPLANNNYNDN